MNFLKQNRILLIAGVGIALLGLAIAGTANVGHAQNDNLSCEDPFEGQNVRFPTSGWETDFCQSNVDFSEIRSGGVPRDGIPPLDNPQFERVEAASDWLRDQSPVISVEINGEARAYPLAIMTWHEIANDTLGGQPIAVTFCPLCNSALVFDRMVDGQELTFGVSGNLRNSDLIMWDRQTESWWQQLTGEAIVGELTGTQLDFMPSQLIGFGDFAERYPDAQVLSRETGFSRSYGSNPYQGYDQVESPFLFEGDVDPRLRATERVLAGIIGGEPVAYPFTTLSDEQVINDTVGGEPIVAIWQPGKASALGAGVIDNAVDVGMASIFSRVVDGQELTFSIDSSGTITDDQTGSEWNIFGEAVAGELEGAELDLEIAAPHFWFAWAAFQPGTMLYGSE